jgi:hypothetical protein
MFRSLVCPLAVACMVASVPVLSHHSAAAQYDVARTITLQGVVREFRFVNPHSVVRLAVTDAQSKETVWSCEWAPTTILRRYGMKPNALVANDRITIVGNPARDGSADLLINSITFADGRRLGIAGSEGTPQGNSTNQNKTPK